MRLSNIAALFSCAINNNFEVTGFSIDSRTINPGDIFIAIRGENFDGHDFIKSAVIKGAAAVISERLDSDVHIPQIIVENSLQALAKIAKNYRAGMTCKVIALTGSNGKTSVKEMIASILPRPAFATQGNLNNHIGVPLCALKLKKEHNYAVFELGANHAGEIAYVVDIVKPDVALINNISPAHIEGFGSIDGVARAKGEIYQGLSTNGIAVINDDDAYAHFWDDIIYANKTLRFSRLKNSDIYAKDIAIDNSGLASFIMVSKQGEARIKLAVPGLHNVSNALAAGSCCLAVGISLDNVKQGLENFRGVSGRMTYKKGINNSVVIDDSYNANLKSTLAAIDVLSARQGFKVLVMGDMGELGDYTEEYHSEVGKSAKNKGIDLVLTLGNHSKMTTDAFGLPAKHFRDGSLLISDLLPYLNAKSTVLVKGSRAAQMEKIVKMLEDNH